MARGPVSVPVRTNGSATKLKSDPEYKAKRLAQKKRWYLTYPGDKYKKACREDHSHYVDSNKDKQKVRNKNRQILPVRVKDCKDRRVKRGKYYQ